MTRLRWPDFFASFGEASPRPRSSDSLASSGGASPPSSRRGARYGAVCAIAAAFLFFHLPFLPASLEDLDSVNFALGIRDFDVPHHQPHPPGYPLFILAAKAVHALGPSEAHALGIVSVTAGALAAFALVALFRRLDETETAWPYAATLIVLTAPLYWFTAARPLSDSMGLAAAIGVQAVTVAAGTQSALVVASLLGGLAIGIRSQVAWLTVPLLLLAIWRRTPSPQGRTAVGIAAAFVGGVLVWAIPLVLLSGGPGPYWASLFSQGSEDLTGITMLWTTPTPRTLLSALYYAFIAPWVVWQLALAVLTMSAFGVIALYRGNVRSLATLGAAFLPYLIFDILFQETFTSRYALPLVVPIAYLAARGLAAAIPRPQGLALAVVLAALSLVTTAPSLAAYSRAEAPAFRLLADMRGTQPPPAMPPVLAMHRREALDLRRPIQWAGDAMAVTSQTLPSPPKLEWLELVKYWNGGGRYPVWFIADPLRSDLALVDHGAARGSYVWPFAATVLIGGVRPNTMDWYTLEAPGWYLGEGWALTPETAGVAHEDGRGPGIAPIQGWIRRRTEAAMLMIGGRNMTPAASRLRVAIDDRLLAERELAPGFFLQMIDLPTGTLTGPGAYAALSVASDSDRVAIEQFDAQSAGHVMFGYGDGWHEPEYNPSTGRQWRWASERASLRVRAEGHALTLSLRGVTEISPRSEVVVRVGDRILVREQVGSTLALSIGIPAEIVSGPEAIITIESDHFRVPADQSWRSSDHRHLAVRVYECRVTPAS